jgi:hypothetical protein
MNNGSGTGTRIAREDRMHIAKLANIDALQAEMCHKARTLKTQIATNPGLKPVLSRYLSYIRVRRAEVIKLVQHLRSLLISLNSIPPLSDSNDAKLQSDQNVLAFEINRWTAILSELNAVDEGDADTNLSKR